MQSHKIRPTKNDCPYPAPPANNRLPEPPSKDVAEPTKATARIGTRPTRFTGTPRVDHFLQSSFNRFLPFPKNRHCFIEVTRYGEGQEPEIKRYGMQSTQSRLLCTTYSGLSTRFLEEPKDGSHARDVIYTDAQTAFGIDVTPEELARATEESVGHSTGVFGPQNTCYKAAKHVAKKALKNRED